MAAMDEATLCNRGQWTLRDPRYPPRVRHTLYEDPVTHKFALIRLPPMYIEGEKVPIPSTARWFGSREEAVATISDFFEQDEDDPIDDRPQ